MNLTHLSAGLASAAVVLAALAAVVLVQTTFVLGIGLAVTRLLRRRGAAVESACQRIVLCAALFAPLASALIGLAVVARADSSSGVRRERSAGTGRRWAAGSARAFEFATARRTPDERRGTAGSRIPLAAGRSITLTGDRPHR